MQFQVGQKLYLVEPRNRYCKPRYVTIEKVGRKWLYLDGNITIDRATLIEKNSYSFGAKCYLSKEEYESNCAIETLWAALRNKISSRYTPPKGITREAMAEAKRLLFSTQ